MGMCKSSPAKFLRLSYYCIYNGWQMVIIYRYVFSLKSKFFLYHVAYYLKKLEKYSQKVCPP